MAHHNKIRPPGAEHTYSLRIFTK